jgi:hypothetical protein
MLHEVNSKRPTGGQAGPGVCVRSNLRSGGQSKGETLVRTHSDTLELVGAWLGHHDIQSSSVSTTHAGAWLTVTNVLVSQANQLLGASYQLYRNAKTNDTIIRTVG